VSLPSASIIIVTFNGRSLLDPCLSAALPQATGLGAEIVLVDNGSSDGTVEHVADRYPEVRIVDSERNLGFAEGCNLGVRHALADRIVLLNNDAVPASGWLESLLAALAEPGALLACSVVHDQGYPESYALGTGSLSVIGHPIPGAGSPSEPFYATGTSLAFDRSQMGEPFNSAFFAYYEDVLLSWHARLQGGRVARAPGSHVDHVGSATASRNRPLATYYYERNKLLTLLLVYEGPTFVRLAPLYIFDGLVRLLEDGWRILRLPQSRFRRLRWQLQRYWLILRGIGWIARHARVVASWRHELQASRTVPDAHLLPLLSGKIFDDLVPSHLHRVANQLAVAYCRLAGIRTLEHGRDRRPPVVAARRSSSRT
jgi:GT2 family glycosyltransferase